MASASGSSPPSWQILVVTSPTVAILAGGFMHFEVNCRITKTPNGISFKIIKDVGKSQPELNLKMDTAVGTIVISPASSFVTLKEIEVEGIPGSTVKLSLESGAYADMVRFLMDCVEEGLINTLVDDTQTPPAPPI